MRWARLLLLAPLGLAFAASCTGGQSGQPSSSSARPLDAGVNGCWSARPFEGSHIAALTWTDPNTSADADAGTHDDIDVMLTVEHASPCGVSGRTDVAVSIATTRLGLVEAGLGVLVIAPETPNSATLSFDGHVVALSATIHLSDASSRMIGTLEAKTNDFPGHHAEFSPR